MISVAFLTCEHIAEVHRASVRALRTDEEIKEHLAADTQTLKLPEPVHPSKIFDFSLQIEINRELGIR